ncbi:MAG: YbaB/EbfC family nucleoid-associated protein [Burkholderiaceae bacterium]|nr:YbaB/EbfC family nucleoid-associated protein [Burkholderiaceae bacterium]MBR5458093.1 YbaB/EbfC family nucleoid-associated protein [Burkholderiaceae bacterium]
MMRGNMGALLKQAQRVQDNIKRLQVELAQLEVEGESSGGLAKVTMTCKHEVKGVKLDPSLLEEDIDMVEDLVFMALKNCCEKIDETTKEKMAKATAGMPLPPGMMF